MRLFVSVDLPDGMSGAVETVQERLRPVSGLRFVDPERAHVTVTFVGDVAEGKRETIDGAVERGVRRAGVEPFEVTYGGLGVFPSLEYISVVWLGVERGGDELGRLHEAVETETAGVGVDPESHEFTPHVTLARMDHAGGKNHVRQVVTEHAPTVGTTTVGAVRLKRSDLGPDGPTYSTVERYPL
jgi:2'-5' RNA ligase